MDEIMRRQDEDVLISIIICIAFIAGMLLGRWSMKKSPTKIEPPAMAIVHADGSQTLERVNTPPPPPLPEPDGAVARTRVAVLEIKPLLERSEIQLDTVIMKDGTHRVTAKGPALDGGQDFSIQIPETPVKKWTLGGGIGFQRYSIFGLRKAGPIDIGAMVQRDRIDRRDWEAQIILAVRF